MTDEPLKIRFSRLVHHDLYRYSIPATWTKLIGEFVLWGALVYLPIMAIGEVMGFSGPIPVLQIDTEKIAWFVFAGLAIREEYCKTTVSEENC